MKDYIKNLVDKKASFDANLNHVREYLQEYFLYILYREKIYTDLVFCGGTALRFIHKIRRFSEDLDFSLPAKSKECDFKGILKTLEKGFNAAGYDSALKYNTGKNVYSAFLKFSGLLFEYGLSSHKDEKLSIKVEVDVNPPTGGKEESTLCNNNFMLYSQHYDISSLFAGKVHALLSRKFTKGRDWYDLLWYLTKFKGIEPNFVMLNNALRQTFPDPLEVTPGSWKPELKKAVDKLDAKNIQNDVYRFLESPKEAEVLTKEVFYAALGQE